MTAQKYITIQCASTKEPHMFEKLRKDYNFDKKWGKHEFYCKDHRREPKDLLRKISITTPFGISGKLSQFDDATETSI